jgi:hypothetical protein
MRTFLAMMIVLCLLGGAWLLQGPSFFMPDRWNPAQGVALGGLSAQLLGAGLLVVGVLGIMASRQASRAGGRAAPRRWQLTYSLLLLLALVLIGSAFHLGEPGPAPHAQGQGPAGAPPH